MIEFSTSQFEWEHGSRPRGYGGWGFLVQAISPAAGATFTVWAHGTLTEAKKQARQQIKKEGFTEAYCEVLP